MGDFFTTTNTGSRVKLKITELESHDDESAIAYTVAFDDFVTPSPVPGAILIAFRNTLRFSVVS